MKALVCLKRMKTLLVILLIAYGQAGLAQDREGVQAFIGCYELRVERHPYVFANYGREFLPKQFELKAEHVYGGFALGVWIQTCVGIRFHRGVSRTRRKSR